MRDWLKVKFWPLTSIASTTTLQCSGATRGSFGALVTFS